MERVIHNREGSVMKRNDDRNVPYLNLNGNKRNLNLNWWSNNWNGNYRFLAVSNSLCESLSMLVLRLILL